MLRTFLCGLAALPPALTRPPTNASVFLANQRLPSANQSSLLDSIALPASRAQDYILRLDPETTDEEFENNKTMLRESFNVVPVSEQNFSRYKALTLAAPEGTIQCIRNVTRVSSFPSAGLFLISNWGVLILLATINMPGYAPPYSTSSQFLSQPNASYGLARIWHRKSSESGYIYNAVAGGGTRVYVLDSGINRDLPDWGTPVWLGRDYTRAENRRVYNGDGSGHGTAVAGVVGSHPFGVAKAATIVSVTVCLPGRFPISSVIEGLAFAIQDAKAGRRIGKAVVNLSLGNPKNQASWQDLNDMVEQAATDGLFVVRSAGDEGIGAANISPAGSRSC